MEIGRGLQLAFPKSEGIGRVKTNRQLKHENSGVDDYIDITKHGESSQRRMRWATVYYNKRLYKLLQRYLFSENSGVQNYNNKQNNRN